MVHRKVQKLVQSRATGFYFRIVVPADLRTAIGRAEIVRSLRTGSQSEAARRCYAFAAAAYAGFGEIRRRRASMTDDQLKALADRYLWDRLDEAETMAASVLMENADNPDAVEMRSDALIDTLESADRSLGTKRQRTQLYRLADKLLQEAGLQVPQGSPEYQRFCLRLFRTCVARSLRR